jgi:tRNA A-37 threonylcarbamoyl transferase component Bud32
VSEPTTADNGTRTWTKTTGRPLRSARKSLGIWLFAHVVGVPVPWAATRQTDAVALLAFEHQRLRELAAAGERVPAVLAFDGHALTTSDIGPTLDYLLFQRSPEERLPLMGAAAADLARFHARGQWHGGAQARNITWDGTRFARLDFEERLVPALPLAMVQRYDVLQLVLSLARLIEPLGSGAVHAVLRAYAAEDAAQGEALRGFIARLLPRLGRISRIAAWSKRLDTSRELMRLRTVLAGMQAFVDAR